MSNDIIDKVVCHKVSQFKYYRYSGISRYYRHDVNEEAGHLVQGVEDERVLPGEDGHSDGSVAQHEV